MRPKLQAASQVLVACCVALFASQQARSETKFGPFVVDPAYPGVILLNGEIDLRSALEFRKALRAVPNARLILLDSLGGSVQTGLLIAEEVFDRKMDTLVPANAICASACSYIFFAGRSRKVSGRLGVHQLQSDVQDNAYTQLNVADVIEATTKYGTAPEVLALMLKTPSDQIHFFSDDEIVRYQINRINEPPKNQAFEIQPSADVAPRAKLSPFSIDKLLESLADN
ncbi:hypothetical protein [Mesorhizobium sp.]|uniref:COG3904 family protein n=1 Tax=Mesorhizobium sp. TaxID=1871066 RepID=UPI000FE4EE1D|nr:hypothetical protein [Mesorhizobium sp.]RWO96931.1 MAG: hypothetical protein EOQ99_32575 [Mesorhizobium sp.]RWP14166.1 MAG: hypothetical protein EOR00_23940 [Mesorhizobium sp.]RWP28060.1 MAG: hypothetical protein EOR02_20595 [Mesorhizobium sp.]RWP57404.1 MAG: hypothetical protein EOR07_31235 [Mesorhizobium sp.]RWQ04136.1 MAG: hypothetical protein EOR89_08635 [Mesorhizobium sp.]